MLQPLSVYLENEAKSLLLKSFTEYGIHVDNRSKQLDRNNTSYVYYSDFCKVLSKFKIAGSNGLPPKVLEFIFSLCEVENENISLKQKHNQRNKYSSK